VLTTDGFSHMAAQLELIQNTGDRSWESAASSQAWSRNSLSPSPATQELQKYLNIFGGIFVAYFLLDLAMSGSVCFSNGWRQAARQSKRIWRGQNGLERFCVATNGVCTVGGFVLYTTMMSVDPFEAVGRKVWKVL